VNLHAPALLPETYCNDVHERLALYKRLASCETREALDAMREELVDRFGDLPEPARVLLDSHLLRVLAKAVGVARIDATHEAVQLQFEEAPSVDARKIVDLAQRRRSMRFTGRDRLRMEAKLPAWPERVAAVKDLLIELAA
jgi:transcription-repair coupling factor (superfamily II helicase)